MIHCTVVTIERHEDATTVRKIDCARNRLARGDASVPARSIEVTIETRKGAIAVRKVDCARNGRLTRGDASVQARFWARTAEASPESVGPGHERFRVLAAEISPRKIHPGFIVAPRNGTALKSVCSW